MSDPEFVSREAAVAALLVDAPGGRVARGRTEVRHLLDAAIEGVRDFYEKSNFIVYSKYVERVRKAVPKIRASSFPEPPIPFDDIHHRVLGVNDKQWRVSLAERVGRARGWAESALRHYDHMGVLVRARQDARRLTDVDLLARVSRDRDAVKVLMTAHVFTAAFDHHYRDPQPVELALIAVAVGLEPPIGGTAESEDARDSSTLRANRWRHTLARGKEYAERFFGIGLPAASSAPPSKGRKK